MTRIKGDHPLSKVGGNHPLCLFTMPASGTHFTESMLLDMGLDYYRKHVIVTSRLQPPNSDAFIVTVRHPYDMYLSHLHRPNGVSLEKFLALMGAYIWYTSQMDRVFYVPIDDTDRKHIIPPLMEFCGVSRDELTITNYDGYKWESNRDRSLDVITKRVERNLGFAVEWYKHYVGLWHTY